MNVLFPSGHHFSSIFYILLNSLLCSIIWMGCCWARIPWDNFWLEPKSLELTTCLATQHSPKFTDDALRIIQESVCNSGNVSLISPLALLIFFHVSLPPYSIPAFFFLKFPHLNEHQVLMICREFPGHPGISSCLPGIPQGYSSHAYVLPHLRLCC